MQTVNHNLTNLATFTPKGKLGVLFAQARVYNQINAQLNKLLPAELSTLELCLIKQHTATLITNNQAVAFRAQKQQALLLKILTNLGGLAQIKKITIKVGLQEN